MEKSINHAEFFENFDGNFHEALWKVWRRRDITPASITPMHRFLAISNQNETTLVVRLSFSLCWTMNWRLWIPSGVEADSSIILMDCFTLWTALNFEIVGDKN